ncbi:MAG: Appr-1-p processing protein [Promethearchaeota archaeon]|jgi:O-acetyl-ADP-ribose deacetylase (regulator of RNase III)
MITYLTGDATSPQGTGNKIIAHICNNIGAWGKGFVLAISRRWKAPEIMYKGWYVGARRREQESKFGLGETQIVRAESGIWVANMVAQDGIYAKKGVPPIRYTAVGSCLEILAVKAKEMPASVHMPRIGCGLAGGEWRFIEAIINDTLIKNDIPVFVYDLGK